MKKSFAPVILITLMVACNSSTDTSATDTTTSIMATDSMAPAVNSDTVVSVTYSLAEGDVIYRDGKVFVMKNGDWAEVHEDVILDNGAVVTYKTRTVKKDGKVIELKEGEIVNKTGNFFDKSGHAIANAWDDTKDAVKDAGEAVGKTAKKVGKKIDSAVSGDHK